MLNKLSSKQKNISLISVSVIVFILLFVLDCHNKNNTHLSHQNTIPHTELDSLKRVINSLESYAIKQERLIDSLKSVTNKTIIKYEKDIKNFSDVYVISDDSIARYIRQKINNL